MVSMIAELINYEWRTLASVVSLGRNSVRGPAQEREASSGFIDRREAELRLVIIKLETCKSLNLQGYWLCRILQHPP